MLPSLRKLLAPTLLLWVLAGWTLPSASHAGESVVEPRSAPQWAKKSKKKKKKVKKTSKKRIKHKIKKGETLAKIARKYDVRVKDIVRWNKLKSPDKIRHGQTLTIRTLSGGGSSSSSSSSKSSKSKKRRKGKTKTVSSTYVVRKGDTLSRIAKKNGVTVAKLKKWNRAIKKNPDHLRVGQKIKLKVKVSSRSSSGGGASQSRGLAYRGKLINGVKLPKGKGYYRRNPKRQYGTTLTIDLIVEVLGKYAKKYPNAPDFAIGDVSFKKGGKMRPHKSHQSGRDVDIGYIDSNGTQYKRFVKMNKKNFDLAKNWYAIKKFIDTKKVEYIFVDYKLQKLLYKYAKKKGVSKRYLNRVFQYPAGKSSATGIIRHTRGHADHMHIRFKCAKSDRKCK